MVKKRQLFTYKSSPGVWDAQLEGQAYIGTGGTELDAITDVLEQFKGISIDEVQVTKSDEPLPIFNANVCSGEEHTITITPNGRKFTAVLTPHDDPRHRQQTKSDPVDTVCALLRKNRGLLRRGNRLSIIVGDTVTNHRMIISYVDKDYVASLEPMVGANADSSPIEALCGVLTANPQTLFEGHRLDIYFPDERFAQEENHEHI